MKKLLLIFIAILGLYLTAQSQSSNDTVKHKETYDEMLARIMSYYTSKQGFFLKGFSMGGSKLNFRAMGKIGNRVVSLRVP